MAFLLHQLLSENAVCRPASAAVFDGEEVLTFGELETLSNRLANRLIALGARPGACVGMHMNRGVFAIIAAMGILKTGAAYVPIDPGSPPNRLRYIITQCAITTLVTVQEKLRNVEEAFAHDSSLPRLIVMDADPEDLRAPDSLPAIAWREIADLEAGDSPTVNVVDTDLAYILFTSGSTGRPKGVMISHLNSMTFINSASEFFGLTLQDRFSHVCPMHFDMSVFDIFVAFKAGAAVVVIPEMFAFFPVKLAELIAKHRISVWNSVPSTLVPLANLGNLGTYDFSSLRLIAFAGEVFPLKHLRRLRECIPGARFCNIYGQTEANSSLACWVEDVASDFAGPLPIGKPLPNFDVFAVTEEGAVVSRPGQEGELYVRGSTVALGYLGDPERMAAVFVQHPLRSESRERVYRTGDFVRMDACGNFVFVGRRDHMIKSRGYRVEIGEIESVLSNHPNVKSAVIIPIPDDKIGHRFVALVVPGHGSRPSQDDLIQHCAAHLPRYMIPEVVEVRNHFPMTSSGKIDRNELKTQIFRQLRPDAP